jgi:hypothetical protein
MKSKMLKAKMQRQTNVRATETIANGGTILRA